MQRRNSPLTLKRVTLAAGPQTAPGVTGLIAATGSKLFCKTALQPFCVKLDTGEEFDFEEGFSYEMAEGDFFSRIELLNPNAAALDVALYIGNARVFRAAPLFTREARTVIGAGSGTFAIGVGAYLSFAAASPGIHRKHIIITNRTSGNTLVVYRSDSAGVIVAGPGPVLTVSYNESKLIATSDKIWIGNASGTATTVEVCEVTYA